VAAPLSIRTAQIRGCKSASSLSAPPKGVSSVHLATLGSLLSLAGFLLMLDKVFQNFTPKHSFLRHVNQKKFTQVERNPLMK